MVATAQASTTYFAGTAVATITATAKTEQSTAGTEPASLASMPAAVLSAVGVAAEPSFIVAREVPSAIASMVLLASTEPTKATVASIMAIAVATSASSVAAPTIASAVVAAASFDSLS